MTKENKAVISEYIYDPVAMEKRISELEKQVISLSEEVIAQKAFFETLSREIKK